MSCQRCGRDRLLAARPGCPRRRGAPARRRWRSAEAAPSAPGWWWSCRSPTRPPAPSARPRSRAKLDALDGVQLAVVGRGRTTRAGPRRFEDGLVIGCPAAFPPAAAAGTGAPTGGRPCSRGLSASSIAWPIMVQARITMVDAQAGRDDRPPGVVEDGVRLEASSGSACPTRSWTGRPGRGRRVRSRRRSRWRSSAPCWRRAAAPPAAGCGCR